MVTKTCGEKFQGANVQECLSLASSSLGVPVEKLKYSTLEEKNGFFKKHAIISIDSIEGLNDENIKDEDFSEKEDAQQLEINGTIEIEDGRIIVKDPCQGGKPAVIYFGNNITVIINGEKINKSSIVTSESKIEFIFKEDEAKREMNLRISEDQMEAYISIIYKPTTIYKLKDAAISNTVTIAMEIKEKIMPPKFTESEIKNELSNNNIKYGVLKMGLIKCTKDDEISELLIASGKRPIEKIDDMVEIKYDDSDVKDNQQNDNLGSIDYKAIGTVSGVEIGQVLAVHHPGKNGEDGVDIAGKIIKVKSSKKIILGVGDGCALKDEFTVVATTKGRPSAKGNTFFVYKTHEINGDVELKTGNIKFVGDIIVNGSVREGMKVEAGNYVLIKNNVSEAEIIANGDVVINGNVIHSSVSAGKEDVLILEYLSDLNSMENDITKLIASIKQLKEMNLLERKTSDGELVKILMETKFKKLSKISIKVAKRILKLGNIEDKLLFIIKNKILDLGPLNIKNYTELNDIVTIINNKTSLLSMDLTLPVDVVLDYCQDSIVKSSGNITFSGKGQYVSQIEASDSVIFQNDKSVARGGVIKAGKEIKCKIVGGPGGVATKLIVENHGHIWAEVAYPNTRFIIGAREYILDAPSKEVHAFIDENRELAVDKLLL
ncbi:FapA family protein [Clostridium tagluense]|uniref:flagellar assembly protein A n=1 Tax=Clostridium tagluense TaxID=360422 RepID=UPI001CF391E4|nr:flagellar assembly protein A [Clostridium tagluense]MCB2310057.1 FapA family protein [Clostridium tagluense]MCB2314413.1 FapA family protein [Clostridium tagluense]MCB2319259.1 FapA family protein [Clostridium tagluense]MCB2324651.1 FapA family protein [Clostridium tagluense]MCB2329502.1 FapA family protein [Clostridium tagluense]